MGKHRNPRKLVENASEQTLRMREWRATAKGKAATEKEQERYREKAAQMAEWLKTEAGQAYREQHREYLRERRKTHREQFKESQRRTYQSLRIEVLGHFSSDGIPRCACCGETEIEFLHIDHVNGDGADHRRRVKAETGKTLGGTGMLYWLRDNNYPDGFQVLCANCNLAKRVNNICPHERRRREAQSEN